MSSFLETMMQIRLYAHICTTGLHLCSRKYLSFISFHLLPSDKQNKKGKKKESLIELQWKNFFLPLTKPGS